jgi:1,4-alpha-glucan branching enzyme
VIEIATIAEALAQLRSGEAHDPHAILGRRPTGEIVELRVWRPGANAVELVATPPVPLTEISFGLFAAEVPSAAAPIDARYRVVDADGIERTFIDPYGFLPTLGELDLHLIAEGHHEDLGLVMGAREVEVEGILGIGFAVWAPSARSVSVVGDFNGWDDYRHPMRSLGASGIWEVFIPEAAVGDCYKYSLALTVRAGRRPTPPRTKSRCRRGPPRWLRHTRRIAGAMRHTCSVRARLIASR